MFALVNGTRRCLGKRRKKRVFRTRGESISQARIAVRTILIGPLYGQLLKENKNPGWTKRVEKFFMMHFFLTFSILLQSLGPRRIWPSQQKCAMAYKGSIRNVLAAMLEATINFFFNSQARSIQLYYVGREHMHSRAA